MGLLLERKLDIDECCESLDGAAVLCMVEEVTVATLELRIPLEYIELRWRGLPWVDVRWGAVLRKCM